MSHPPDESGSPRAVADVPVFAAYANARGGLAMWCPNCVTWHYHGSGDGSRVAHCPAMFSSAPPVGRFDHTGYVVETVGPWSGEDDTPRADEPLRHVNARHSPKGGPCRCPGRDMAVDMAPRDPGGPWPRLVPPDDPEG